MLNGGGGTRMLLAIDIGNTQTSIGVFKDSQLLFDLRFKTDRQRTRDEYAVFLEHSFRARLGSDPCFEQGIISSVVPSVTANVSELVKNLYKLDCLYVGPGVKSGISLKVSDPSSVGADRVVNAVAVRHLYGTPALVIDFGTATSFDYVGKEGNYEGGMIAPGVEASLEALVRNTAKLPHIDLSWPRTIVGKTTSHCMQSGTVVGFACMIDGLIAQVEEEVGPIAHVVATGSLGKLFVGHCERIKQYEEYLTLQGLRLVAELNRS